MIRPDMATMLAYIGTDAAVSQRCLDRLVKFAADSSFNRITVDGDTSTNDSFILIATGAAGNAEVDDEDHPGYCGAARRNRRRSRANLRSGSFETQKVLPSL